MLLHFESRLSSSLIIVYVEIQDEGFLACLTSVSCLIRNRVLSGFLTRNSWFLRITVFGNLIMSSSSICFIATAALPIQSSVSADEYMRAGEVERLVSCSEVQSEEIGFVIERRVLDRVIRRDRSGLYAQEEVISVDRMETGVSGDEAKNEARDSRELVATEREIVHSALFAAGESGSARLDRSGPYAQENVRSVGRMGIELSDERFLDKRVREESLVEGLPRSAFTEEYLESFDKRMKVESMEQLVARPRMSNECLERARLERGDPREQRAQ
jgi:hypothetical protein